MQDRELYRQILGIESPWQVGRVEMKPPEGSAPGAVHVYLEHGPEAEWQCGECGQPARLYDHQAERRWRHLDTCQYQTILHARPPRAECAVHGVRVVKLPWAEASSRFTAPFEALAISWLQQASQRAVAAQLHLSWDEIHALLQRAVRRGLARRQTTAVRYVGIDEKAVRKRHVYFTLVNDLERGCVLYVADGRKQESLDQFWRSRTAGQNAAVEAVAMDMWEPFYASTLEHVPGAAGKIVFDRFHIAQHLGAAVDQVRRTEHRQLCAEGDDRLKGTKYAWLRHPATMARAQRQQLDQLRKSNLKTARAWALKGACLGAFEYHHPKRGAEILDWFTRWAARSRIQPMIAAGRMIRRHRANIVTFFRHRITNATSESINAKIQWIKYTARGFRNRDNFKTAIYFHCGGLDLAPTK